MALRPGHRFSIDGLQELDAALGELPKATARNALRRVLRSRAEPLRDDMARRAPDDPETGGNDLRNSIRVSAKLNKKQKRLNKNDKAFAEIFVGPESGRNSAVGSRQEFGTVNHGAQPFARPSWDAGKGSILDGIKDDLWSEIEKAAARLAKRRAKAAGG